MQLVQSLSIKQTLVAVLASLAMVVALAVPASAQTTNCSTTGAVGVNVCPATNTDNSTNLGPCAVLVNGDNDADADGGDGDDGGNGGAGIGVIGSGTGGAGGAGGNGGAASANVNQNISTDCSTNNVTNVTQAAAAAEKQVSAPRGAVHAGAGSSNISAIVGLVGSVVTLGAGFATRKFEL